MKAYIEPRGQRGMPDSLPLLRLIYQRHKTFHRVTLSCTANRSGKTGAFFALFPPVGGRLFRGLTMYRSILLTSFLTFALAACGKDPEVAKREFLKSGDDYAAQGKFSEAVIEYRNAIQQDPRSGEARFKLGDALRSKGDLTGAYREYIRAADLLPRDVKAQVMAGQMYRLANQFEDARARADRALDIDPKNVDALLIRGTALAGLKEVDAGVAEVKKAIAADPTRAITFAALGGIQMLQGARSDAEASFKRAVELAPKDATPRVALANFYWVTGQAGPAEKTLLDAIAAGVTAIELHQSLAYLYVTTGRVAEAEPHLRKVVDETKDPMALMALSDYYQSAGKHAQAIDILDKLAADPKLGTAAKIRKAAMLYAAGKTQEAHALVDDLRTKTGNTDASVLMTKADFLVRERKFDDAVKMAETAVARDPQSLAAQFGLARIQAARGARSEAIAAYTEALKLRPRFPAAQAELAAVYIAEKRADDALARANDALSTDPQNFEALLAKTRALLMKGDVTRAAEPLLVLTTKYSASSAVQAQVGLMHALKQEPRPARAAFEQALKIDPTNAIAISGMVQLALGENDRAGARAHMDNALAHARDNVDLLLIGARIYATLGDKQAAENALKHAIEVSPGSFEAYDLLGRLYASEGRLQDAIGKFETVLQQQPRSIMAHTMIGVLLEAQNKRDEARKRYETAVAIDSTAPVAANNLAWIYAETNGNLDVALQLAQAAKTQLPNTPEVGDTIGWIYLKKGLPELAVKEFKASIDKDTNNQAYWSHLGLAYAKIGDFVKAKEILERTLQRDPNVHAAAEARAILQQVNGKG